MAYNNLILYMDFRKMGMGMIFSEITKMAEIGEKNYKFVVLNS